ncbi:MAG: hypothetical protein RIB59_13995 [Rhodospirillales bacterium]
MAATHNSTIITFGLTIQDILASHGEDPLIETEALFGLFSHTRPIAKGFLRQIKREFETNEFLKELFPDVLWAEPKREAPKWSEDEGLIVKRRSNPKESTVEAWGLVDGQPTSRHFNRLVYDDVVTRDCVTTPEMIKKVTDAWGLSLNLGVEGGVKRLIGTRYHYNDTYKAIIERGAAIPRLYPATEDGTIDGVPVLVRPETLSEKRRAMGPYIFGCQMLLNPKAEDAQAFHESWLAYWPARHAKGLNLYILVDPAAKKTKNSDYTFMAVVGLGADGVYRVVTMIRDRLNLTERADALFALHREYRPLSVGYEEYGLQADIEHMKDRMNRENYKFSIKALGGRLKKEDRIRRLVPLFEQTRLLLPETCPRATREGVREDLTKIFVNEEYLAFPVGAHDDMLDGLSRITDPAFPMAPPRDKRAQTQTERAAGAYDPHRW